jgi:23S rRNA (adenine2503-C2)-methyltransferase
MINQEELFAAFAKHMLTLPSGERRINLKDLMPDELEQMCLQLGLPKYRAGQLIRWIYVRLETDFEKMTDLGKPLRSLLAQLACVPEIQLHKQNVSRDQDTDKFLFRLSDGALVESVRMRYLEHLGPGRVAVCISSQVGCAMACDFCASGLAGLKRNLATWEIVDQVIQIQKLIADRGERVANVVYMGIGEPMQNFDNLLRSIRILHLAEGLGIGLRHLCISTSGLVPQILKLAAEKLPIRLAISLHATNDALRNEMMPVNRRWPLAELLAACREYQRLTDRRITWEYVMLDGINDSLAEAERLGEMVRGMRSLVNLIPWNAVEGARYKRSSSANIRAFQNKVEHYGVKCTVRAEKGADIDAACGQLRLQEAELLKRPARKVAASQP